MLLKLFPFLSLVGGGPDQLFWHFNPNGMFSTNSAYRVSQMRLLLKSSLGGVETLKWWEFLWKAKFPKKSNY